MPERVLPVNAYTTLDLAAYEAEGHGWLDESHAVVDVATEDGQVILELEADGADTSLDAHADRLRLDADDARTLAAALDDAAEQL
ncbi:DUF6360 family protein [Halobacterium zhouii]|uniref:DUF6360 family protein n=1 Tax=Halobacterium zhouii TaxID=2902624 RepID=UPI001E4E63FA|nr:DUF6360 family protein [Halobacterium zhouii]